MHRHLELNICENPVGEWFSSFMSQGYSPVVKGDCLGDRDNLPSVVNIGLPVVFAVWRTEMSDTRGQNILYHRLWLLFSYLLLFHHRHSPM